MINPVTNLLALGRMPTTVAADVAAVANAMLRASVTERTPVSRFQSELRLVSSELARVRSAVELQQKRVARVEQAVQSINKRTAVIEQTVIEIQGKAPTAPTARTAKAIGDPAISDTPTATETATKPLIEVDRDQGRVPVHGDGPVAAR